MKFCKKYEEYREAQDQGLVWVDCKKLEKILKMCRIDQMDSHDHQLRFDGSRSDEDYSRNHRNCAVCDGAFFPSLHEEMSAVVGCFNKRAQKLLQQHLASGIRKYFTWVKGKNQGNRIALVREGKDLVTYALINVIAFRKILKKYDKIHFSEKGQAFKSQAQNMQIEILRSPWLRELIAFHVNSGRAEVNSDAPPALFDGFSLTFNDDKPSLTCELFDYIKLDIELTCSICLDTIFDPVSLGCGHMFCYMCACSAASVCIVDGLKAAEPKHQCPLCRQRRVYADAVLLKELNILVSQSYPEYWEKRRQSERIERVRQAKEHWESISRAFMGV